MRSFRSISRRLLTIASLVCSTVATTGCLGGLSASSSCRDFLHASRSAQEKVVSKLAADVQSPDLAGPFGPPMVRYSCAASPDKTLGELVSDAG